MLLDELKEHMKVKKYEFEGDLSGLESMSDVNLDNVLLAEYFKRLYLQLRKHTIDFTGQSKDDLTKIMKTYFNYMICINDMFAANHDTFGKARSRRVISNFVASNYTDISFFVDFAYEVYKGQGTSVEDILDKLNKIGEEDDSESVQIAKSEDEK